MLPGIAGFFEFILLLPILAIAVFIMLCPIMTVQNKALAIMLTSSLMAFFSWLFPLIRRLLESLLS